MRSAALLAIVALSGCSAGDPSLFPEIVAGGVFTLLGLGFVALAIAPIVIVVILAWVVIRLLKRQAAGRAAMRNFVISANLFALAFGIVTGLAISAAMIALAIGPVVFLTGWKLVLAYFVEVAIWCVGWIYIEHRNLMINPWGK